MRLARWVAYAAALGACASAFSAEPEYSATVRQSYTSPVQRVALAPISCPQLEQLGQRLILAEGLGVQGFALVRIRNATIETTGPAADDKWRELKREVQVKRAALELRIIARDGAVLAHVEGAAHVTGIKGLQGVAERLFEVMIERLSERN